MYKTSEFQGLTLSHFRREIRIYLPILYNPFYLHVPSAFDDEIASACLSYLEKSLQPPHLEDTLSYQHSQLEY